MAENVDMESLICSDRWRVYEGCDRYFDGHGVVIHADNFLNPPREQDPQSIAGQNFPNECTDRLFIGPCPLPPHPIAH